MAQKLLVRSNDRDVSSVGSHNFTVSLPDSVQEGKFKLRSCQIYNTAYTITQGVNDKIYCSLGNKQITPGYYASGTAFATQLQTDLQTVSATFTVAYSSTTSKFTFANTAAFIFQWANSIGDDCTDQLGFLHANTVSSTSLVSNFIPVLPQSTSIMIQIAEAQSTDYYRTTNAKSDLLGAMRIPIDVGFGSIINHIPKKNYEQFITIRGTKKLTVRLYDEQGRPYNLQGADWTMELERCGDFCH